MSFKNLGLQENILKAIEECGYTDPTPIQAQAIPPILMARDVVGVAQTGTGKTAGFTLPMIEILAEGRAKARMPRSLILSPTRELAAQIAENFDTYGKYTKLSKALLTGGVSIDDQIKKLERGVDVLIATPGRLLDLFERGKILLTDIKILVIDEADRMLDMGFIPDIEKIVGLLSPMRQTLLFSATMPPEIRKLTNKFLSNPKEISVAPPSSTAERVDQYILWVSARQKKQKLEELLRRKKVQNAFIFCNRKRDIDGVCRYLKDKGYDVKPLHGDMPQDRRAQTLKELKAGEVDFLVCSDVAARGLDVDDLSHVYNYDVPTNAEDYVHRIGRTGRAGKDGTAWTLAVKGDEKYVQAIEKIIGKPIPTEGQQDEKGKKEDSQKNDSKQTDKKNEKSRNTASKDKQGGSSKSENNVRNMPKNKNTSKGGPQKGDQGDVTGFGDEVPSFFQNA